MGATAAERPTVYRVEQDFHDSRYEIDQIQRASGFAFARKKFTGSAAIGARLNLEDFLRLRGAYRPLAASLSEGREHYERRFNEATAQASVFEIILITVAVLGTGDGDPKETFDMIRSGAWTTVRPQSPRGSELRKDVLRTMIYYGGAERLPAICREQKKNQCSASSDPDVLVREAVAYEMGQLQELDTRSLGPGASDSDRDGDGHEGAAGSASPPWWRRIWPR